MVEVHDADAVHARESPWLETGFEAAQREMEEVPRAARVSGDVIAIGLEPGERSTGRGTSVPPLRTKSRLIRAAGEGAAQSLDGVDRCGLAERGPSENAWYPADWVSVTVLYNAFPCVPPFGGADLIAALALGRTPPPTPAAPTSAAPLGTPATSIAAEDAQREFVRGYEISPGAVFTTTFEDGSFYITPPRGTRQPLVHESGATYAVGRSGASITATFLADAEGRVVGILARQNGSERTLRKISP